MIFESYPWKKDLLRRKNQIIRYNSKEQFKKNDKVAYTAIEKGIFYSAFVIRKLVDCKVKLSNDADKYQMQVKVVKSLKKFNILHRWPDENSHDWKNGITKTVQGKDICNWLIHSYIFNIIENDKSNFPVDSFMVSSDYDKNKFLYIVTLNDWLKYIDFIANDSIVEMSMHYDEQKADYFYKTKKRGR